MVNYVAQVVINIAIFVILAISLNLVLGYGGIFSLAQGAFFGIGAYAASQSVLLLGVPFPVDLIAAFLLAALIAGVIGPPIARLREEYVIVGTLALQLVLSNIFLNWQPVTGGSYGLFGIPRPTIGPWQLTGLVDYAALAVVVAALCFAVLHSLTRSPFGLALKGLREDPDLAQSFGSDVKRQRALVFALGAGVAGIAGCVYARYIGYIDPTTFQVSQSLSVITILVVGGIGNLWGTLLAAAILVTVPQVLRFIPATSNSVGYIQLILYGVLLLVLVRTRPQGLISERPIIQRRVRRSGTAARHAPSGELTAEGVARDIETVPVVAERLMVDHLSKAFGGVKAVNDLSFTIEPGEVTALIGPNGAGKTTVFNLLTSYEHSDSGTVRYRGQEITQLPPFAVARLGIARSFQDVRVFSRMTVLENLVFAMQGAGGEGNANSNRPSFLAFQQHATAVDEALALLGAFDLAEDANERVANLSYAQQKLLVVAMLVAERRPLILLDELAAGLDHDSIERFSRLVRQMLASGHCICLIEHNLDFVWQTADRVLVLDQGGLIAEGTPDQIKGNSQVAEVYFGSSDAAHA